MLSAGKIAANRANSKKSTGPKTAKGKARASKNARRHGLSISVLADPKLAKEIEALAQEIAGATTSPEVFAAARLVAEAQITAVRARQYRHNFLKRFGINPKSVGVREVDLGDMSPTQSSYQLFERVFKGAVETEVPMAPYFLEQLVKIYRYEQRALSERKFAIRMLDIEQQAEKRRREQQRGGEG